MTVDPGVCFCCSQKPFSECCEPILKNHGLALTPLALMRSRYTAYVLSNEKHLLATWAQETRPENLTLQDTSPKWLELFIHGDGVDATDHDRGWVDFSARYIESDQLCTLRENSSFVRRDGLWYYMDGATQITRTKLARNAPCPCGSGRKFKRCCLGR